MVVILHWVYVELFHFRLAYADHIYSIDICIVVGSCLAKVLI